MMRPVLMGRPYLDRTLKFLIGFTGKTDFLISANLFL